METLGSNLRIIFRYLDNEIGSGLRTTKRFEFSLSELPVKLRGLINYAKLNKEARKCGLVDNINISNGSANIVLSCKFRCSLGDEIRQYLNTY